MSHTNQHYVPAFLLRSWEDGTTGRLTQFQWMRGQLLSELYSAKSVAKVPHLYSLRRSEPEPDVQLERDFLGPVVDDPASVVLQIILSRGVGSLDPGDAANWIHFLVALIARNPEIVEAVRARGRQALLQTLEANPQTYLEPTETHPGILLTDWLKEKGPDALDDFGATMLPDLTAAEGAVKALVRAMWMTRTVKGAKFDLLSSDRPLMMFGSLGSDFAALLPLTPRTLFVACSSGMRYRAELMLNMNDDSLAKQLNRWTVGSARKYVYATSAAQEALVAKLLRKPA